MCRLGLGLLLLVMAVATNATELEDSVFFRHPDLLTVQIVQLDTDGLVRAKPYRLSLSIVPIHSADNMPIGSGSSNLSRLHPVVEQPVAWATTDNLSRFFDRDHASSSPLLRLESKGQRLEIRPRRHSVSIQWTKTLP